MTCSRIYSRKSSNSIENNIQDSITTNQCNESWLFRILNGATAFGEMLSQQPLRNVQNPTDIVNMLGRDLAGEVALEASQDITTSKQFGIEYSIQRWLALRASTQSGEGRLGASLAGPLEKKKPRSSSVPVSPPSSDADLAPVRKPKTFITTTALAEPTAVQDIPQLTNQEKVSLIAKEFGPLTKENEEEQLLAEVDASFFQDVAILGVVHLTTHRITFHASLLNTRPDLASSKQILHSGYVDIRSGRFRRRHRVWMELMSDMITTYRSSAEEERVRPLCTLLLSTVRKVYPPDSSHPLQVKLDSVSLVNGKKPENKESYSFFHRFRHASHHTDISSTDSVQESGPPQGTTHVIELGTIEAAFAWRKELLAALYLFSKRRNLLLSDFNKKDSDSQDSDLDSESEQGVRINIPLERIKTYKLYQWDFASILQVDISTLSGAGSTFDDIPLGSPLLPIVPPLEENITLTRTESPETNTNLDSDGDIDNSQQTSEDTRFQFALLKGNETWLRFNHLVEVAREKRISASEASTSSTLVDSPVTVDFGTLTFVESRVPIFETDNQSDRKAIITHSREREVRRLFGLPNELDIWFTKCCRCRHTLKTTGLLIISSKFICFWSRLVGTSDIRLRYHTEDLRSVSASHTWKYGFALTIRVVGHANLVFDFSKSDVRDEASRRLQALIPVNLPLRMSSTGEETKRSSSLLSISSPTTTSPDSSIVIKRTTSPKPTALLSPMSRTVSKLRARSFPPALIPHLAKPINLPADIPPFGISPRHFVILTIGSRGDVQPYIALGKGLVELGHRVTLVTHEEYKPWIEGNGLRHRPIAGDPGALMKLNVDHKMFSPGFFRESLTNFRGWIDELLTLAWEHCKDADVLIESPSAMAGIHIAEALKIPYFRAFTMPWSKTSQFPHPFISPPLSNNAKFNLASYALFDNVFWMGTSSQINRWRKKRLGLPATDMGHLAQEKIPFLYNFSPSVVPKPAEWGDQITVSGYWFLDNPDLDWTPSKELLNFIERARTDNKPLVYIGFGSITVPSPSDITKNIVKAVLKSDVRAILSKGWSSRMQKVTEDDVEIPSEILVIDKAPHDWLFAQMSVVVHHGGAGTTGASLRAGIPTIIKPWFGDQFFWASRVQRLGVGLRLSNIRSGELAEALKKATTDVSMQEKAVILGERIRAENGVSNAIRSIYTYLDRAGKDRTTL